MENISTNERAGIVPDDILDMVSMYFEDQGIEVTGPTTKHHYKAAENAVKALRLADEREADLINRLCSLMVAAADEAFLSGVRAGIQMHNAMEKM